MGYRLLTEDYCESCPAFEAHVEHGQPMYINGAYMFNAETVIDCKHRDRCEAIKKHLEKQLGMAPLVGCCDACKHESVGLLDEPCFSCNHNTGSENRYEPKED